MSLMNLQLLGTSHTIHPTVCVTHEPTTVRYKSHNPSNCLCHSWTYNRQVQVTQSIQLSVSLMNLQPLGTSHTIHPTVCVTHEPTTVRYKSHNPSNCLCHSWTYNRQIQVTQSIQLSVSLMNLQPSDTSHTIHPTVCVTHEPTTIRYKSHNSIQLSVSLMNLQPLGTSHTIHPTVCVTHEPTTVRYKSHNSIQLSVSLMNLQPSGTSHTIHPTVCVTHEPTTVRYKSHNPSNCLCHSWTYNRQVQVTQLHPTVCVTHEPTTIRYKSHNSIQLSVSLMNLQPSGTSHTTLSNCLCHSWNYNHQVQVIQLHPTVCVTHEPTTVRYKSHNPSRCICQSWTYNRQVQVTQSIQLPVSLVNLQPSGTSRITPSKCLVPPMNVQPSGTSHTIHPDVCHSWTYNHQVQVTQSIQLLVPPMNLQPSGTSHTIHPTVCVTHEPTTVRYKSHNPFNCLCHSWTYNRQVQVTQSIQLSVSPMNLQPSGTSHTIHSTVCATHEPTTVRYKSHNPSRCICHSWTYNC